MIKRKLVIVTEGFPYWVGENFLNGEIACLHEIYDISILPLVLPKNATIQPLPANVKVLQPVMVRNYILRFLLGVFNLSPIWFFLQDFFGIFKDGKKNILYNFVRWSNVFICSRSLYSSKQLRAIKKDKDIILYVYWCSYPIDMFKTFPNKVFSRVHGTEFGTLISSYIPVRKHRLSIAPNISYIPISLQAAEAITEEIPVKYIVNRLGVFKNEINKQLEPGIRIRIVSVAYLIKVKRINLIIEALKKITELKIEWVHFGNGPLSDDIFNESKLLGENIDVRLKGFVSNGEIIRFYRDNYVDLFINVSEIEGVPVSIMEALSFGIPCFATNVGGTREIVNNENGKIVDKDFDVSELAKFIKEIRDLSAQNHYRKNALNTWEEKSNAVENYKQLARIFNS